MEKISASQMQKRLYQILKEGKIYRVRNKTSEAYLIPINRIDNCKFEIDSANQAAEKAEKDKKAVKASKEAKKS